MAISDGRNRNLVSRIYVFASQFLGATYTLGVKLFLSEFEAGPALEVSNQGFDIKLAGARAVTPYRRGRYMELEFGTAGPTEPWEAEGFDMDIKPGGGSGR